MGAALHPEEAEQILRDAGFEPLAPFPGTGTGWPARCTGCGKERKPRLDNIRQGKRCLCRRSKRPSEAAAMRDLLARQLIKEIEKTGNAELLLLRRRISGALQYMEGVTAPNHITLDHIQCYLTGAYDSNLPEEE